MVHISTCPCCGERLEIAKMHCPSCDCIVEGSMDITPFDTLDRPLLDLAALFIECDGSFKKLGERLGVCQMTAKKRFTELKDAIMAW